MKPWKTRLNREHLKRRHLHNLVQELRGNIRVFCRVRPLIGREEGCDKCADVARDFGNSAADGCEVVTRDPVTQQKRKWEFDHVFGPKSTQAQVFEQLQPLVTSVIDGYNVCVFAYGQTGSGKTYSMQGGGSGSSDAESHGIYDRTFAALFDVKRERNEHGFDCELQVSVLEIYTEQIRDLLLQYAPPTLKPPQKINRCSTLIPTRSCNLVLLRTSSYNYRTKNCRYDSTRWVGRSCHICRASQYRLKKICAVFLTRGNPLGPLVRRK